MSGVSGPPIITDGTVGTVTLGSFGTAVVTSAYWLVVVGVIIGLIGVLWMLYGVTLRRKRVEWRY